MRPLLCQGLSTSREDWDPKLDPRWSERHRRAGLRLRSWGRPTDLRIIFRMEPIDPPALEPGIQMSAREVSRGNFMSRLG